MIKDFFDKNQKVAIAFSGGVDSAFLAFLAKKYATDVKLYFVKSEFQPEFELRDSKKLSEMIGLDLEIIEHDILKNDEVKKNSINRCYYCKKSIFSKIKEQAAKDGYEILLDGTNASDDSSNRPGMKAAEELAVLSPLKDCGYTKEKIRSESKNAGLFTWSKPSYACLATRIKTDEEITQQTLRLIEKGENYLFSEGFRDFRIRISGNDAKLQLKESQFELLFEKKEKINNELRKLFVSVSLDLEARE